MPQLAGNLPRREATGDPRATPVDDGASMGNQEIV